ncbi:hypothetical protein BDW22DRAFT_338034 [Trametopsis cervina]|nr:hypothetical protein BDW22DRAFT_338034 [Trametopsis cervina]
MSSTEEHNPQPPRVVATAPFNHPSADVVFVSADGVEFRLHRVILSLASSFFNDMFSTSPTPDIEEAIRIPEDSKVFDYMMRFCYPIHHTGYRSTFGSADDSNFLFMTRVLEASVKYDLGCSSKALARAMNSWQLSPRGRELYPLYCRLNLEEDARLAAQSMGLFQRRRLPVSSPVFEKTLNGAYWNLAMSQITAAQYFRLLHYLRAPDGLSALCLLNAPFVNPETRPNSQDLLNNSPEAAASLIASYLNNAESASTDVVMVSYDGFELPAHTLILRLGSAAELLDNQATSDAFVPRIDDINIVNAEAPALRPRIHIQLSGRVLADLLSLCYNQTRWQEKIGLERLASCVEAASRFHITKALDSLRRHVATQTDEHPLAVYFIAGAQGWVAEAKAAAILIAKKQLETQYTPEMEDVPAVLYHRMLHFCHRYTTATRAVAKQRTAGWNFSDAQDMSSSDNLDAKIAHIVAPDDAYQEGLREAISRIDLECGSFSQSGDGTLNRPGVC